MSYLFLPLDAVIDTEPVAAELGVSQVARSARGFLSAFKRAGGDPERLPEKWHKKRDAFIKRHMAQVKKRKEPLWKKGNPTRRHLALIMWAYSPHAKRFFSWLNRIYENWE